MSTAPAMSRRALLGRVLAPSRPSPAGPSLADLRRRWCAAAGSDDLSGPQCVPDGRAAIAALFAPCAPGDTVRFTVWSSGAGTALLRAAERFDPLPRGVAGPFAWGRRERLRQELDRHADEITYHRHVVTRPADLDVVAAGMPPVQAALARGGEPAREHLSAILAAHAEGATVALPYLVVTAVARARTPAPPPPMPR